MIRLALFDMDGTLFDTREANFLSYERACAERGITIDREFFLTRCYGRNYRDFLPDLGVPPELIVPVHDVKVVYYNDYLDSIVKNQHLFDLIDIMAAQGIPSALVTTASKVNTMDILRVHGCTDSFALIMTQEDCDVQKPAPDCYLKAMAHFGVSPEECIIFEDAPAGIAAARASGASVYIVG
ncbi:MAG: HAD family phosphatase [Oscillospiraceae bacterium]|nr:HAD family phosphatase [Oscillospiraceae bacterium]